MSKIHWEPKIPSKHIILDQAKQQIIHGKSTGNINLDIEAIDSLKSNQNNVKRKRLIKLK